MMAYNKKLSVLCCLTQVTSQKHCWKCLRSVFSCPCFTKPFLDPNPSAPQSFDWVISRDHKHPLQTFVSFKIHTARNEMIFQPTFFQNQVKKTLRPAS